MADELKCGVWNMTHCSWGLFKHLGRTSPPLLKVSAAHPPTKEQPESHRGVGRRWQVCGEALTFQSAQVCLCPGPLLCQWDVPSAGCVGRLWAPALSVCGF